MEATLRAGGLVSDNSDYQEKCHGGVTRQNIPADRAGVQYCTPATPQPKVTQMPNNAVKLFCSNMNSYLLGRQRGLGQLFFPLSRGFVRIKIHMKARQVQ
jgi:hypothetical protein